MSKRLRYIILAVGFVAFLILAPLIVMYVRGLSFDTKSKGFIETGLFAIRTEPKSTEIYINGVLTKDSGGDVKFLEPGEYNVAIKKEGYRDWSKRLEIRANQVTWVSPAPNKLYLFKSSTTPITLTSGVLDFTMVGSDYAAISSSTLSFGFTDGRLTTEDYTLPKSVSSIIPSSDKNVFLLTNATQNGHKQTVLAFNRKTQKFADLTALFSGSATFTFAGNGSLFALDNGTLYTVNIPLVTKTKVLANIQSFTLLDDILYYVNAATGIPSLVTAKLDGSDEQVLDINLPAFTQGQLYVTRQKQIFLLADGTLYKINQTAEQLASGVSEVHFDQYNGTLIAIHSGEVSSYNFEKQRMDFVTRSGQALTNPILHQFVSMAFLSRDNAVTALELDTRDHQNEYEFYKGTDIKKFVTDEEARNLYILDSGVLKRIEIR